MKFAVPSAKIVDYLLKNQGKRNFFFMFGYSVENWERLRQDILQFALENESAMRERRTTSYGTEYEMIGELLTPAGRTVLLKTSWYRDTGEAGTVRFITAYPAGP